MVAPSLTTPSFGDDDDDDSENDDGGGLSFFFSLVILHILLFVLQLVCVCVCVKQLAQNSPKSRCVCCFVFLGCVCCRSFEQEPSLVFFVVFFIAADRNPKKKRSKTEKNDVALVHAGMALHHG